MSWNFPGIRHLLYEIELHDTCNYFSCAYSISDNSYLWNLSEIFRALYTKMTIVFVIVIAKLYLMWIFERHDWNCIPCINLTFINYTLLYLTPLQLETSLKQINIKSNRVVIFDQPNSWVINSFIRNVHEISILGDKRTGTKNNCNTFLCFNRQNMYINPSFYFRKVVKLSWLLAQ